MTPEATLELADQLFHSIERGDLGEVRSLYADDIVITRIHEYLDPAGVAALIAGAA